MSHKTENKKTNIQWKKKEGKIDNQNNHKLIE